MSMLHVIKYSFKVYDDLCGDRYKFYKMRKILKGIQKENESHLVSCRSQCFCQSTSKSFEWVDNIL
jgi:hypothetical protein